MANFFLGHLETLIFKDQMSCHPKLYIRYIDDVFAVFDDVNACSFFSNILNSQHDNIKFTNLLKSPLTLCNFWMLISKLVRILLIHGSGESLLIRVYSLTLLLYVPFIGNLV